MKNSEELKKLVISLGADLCGIASYQSFSEAPSGFHPLDIWSETRSVLVFALRIPGNSESAESPVPYTLVNGLMAREVDRMSLGISRRLDHSSIGNVIIPSDDPYESWSPVEMRGEAILSMRHAALLAGLGRIGRSGLLINGLLGNMIQIGAILLDRDFCADRIAEYQVCPENCSICIDECPVSALDGNSTVQKLCRPLSVSRNDKDFVIKKCWRCRSLCPSRRGVRI